MKTIPLSNGQFAIVDDEDYALLSTRKWHARKSKHGTWYAFTSVGMARLIMGEPQGQLIDHKDGNGLNNQKSNLRACTALQNTRNSRGKGAKSGYKGVYETKFHRWAVIMHINGKSKNMGTYATKEEAAGVYNAHALRLHGEFARLNKLPGNA